MTRPVILKLKRRIKQILWESDPEPIEILLAFIMLIWGLTLAAPPYDKFNLPIYRVMASLAPQFVWGVIMAAIGIGALYGILMEITPLRKFTSLSKTIIWSAITASILLVTTFTPSAILIVLLAITSIWVYLRVSKKGG